MSLHKVVYYPDLVVYNYRYSFFYSCTLSSVSDKVQIKFVSQTLCAVSRGSPPLIKIPFCAPTPVPTITAVGVAKPSEQGQAITSTLIAANSAHSSCV